MANPATEYPTRYGDPPAYPYFPSDRTRPFDRGILFASFGDQGPGPTKKLTPTTLLVSGENVMGWWMSPTLSRDAAGEEMTLRTLGFHYSSVDDSFFDVSVSGDGGNSWKQTRRFNILGTNYQIRRIRLAFNVTGYDLRFRIAFPTEVPIKIYNYYPSLVRRGRIVL